MALGVRAGTRSRGAWIVIANARSDVERKRLPVPVVYQRVVVVFHSRHQRWRCRRRPRTRCGWLLLLLYIVAVVVSERVRFHSVLFHSLVFPVFMNQIWKRTHALTRQDSSSTLFVAVEKAGQKLASHQNQNSTESTHHEIFSPSMCGAHCECECLTKLFCRNFETTEQFI